MLCCVAHLGTPPGYRGTSHVRGGRGCRRRNCRGAATGRVEVDRQPEAGAAGGGSGYPAACAHDAGRGTNGGWDYLPGYAAKVCGEIDIARETILPAGALRGRFRIAAPLTFGPTHFASVIAELAQQNPELQVQTCYSDRFVDLIADGFDCAIRVGHLSDSSMMARRVGWTRAKYVAAPGYIEKHGSPQTPEEFVTHQVVMQGTESWPVKVGDKVVLMKPQGRFKADNALALVAAALAGVGLAGLPEALITEHLASGALVEVMPRYPLPELGIYVIRPPGRHPARKIRALTEMLIECFGESALNAQQAG